MIDVACALITRLNGQVLVTQRSASMRLPLKWEFPGGKVEPDETAESCIVREITEELMIKIKIVKRGIAHEYGEGKDSILLIPFYCKMITKEIKLTEHVAFNWLFPDELISLDWAEADLPVLQDYLDSLSR